MQEFGHLPRPMGCHVPNYVLGTHKPQFLRFLGFSIGLPFPKVTLTFSAPNHSDAKMLSLKSGATVRKYLQV